MQRGVAKGLSGLALLVSLAVLSGCETPAGDGGEEGDESGTETGDDTGVFEDVFGEDVCSAAPVVSTGLWPGNLRDAAEDLGGACDQGGPDVFFRVELSTPADLTVHARGVGFSPRVGVLPTSCVSGREIACTEGLPTTLTDLPAGTELIVTVGIDPDSPALDEPAPDDGSGDPLAFELALSVRRILDPGALCQPSALGRCATGTACSEDPEEGAWRCAVLGADTCATAARVEIPGGFPSNTQLELDPLETHSDAHHHGCTGVRMREAVYALELPAGLPPGAQLTASVDDPAVGLALRSPGCAASDEIACASPGPQTSVTFPNADVAGSQGVVPLLFVELPDPPAPEPQPEPVTLTLEVVDG